MVLIAIDEADGSIGLRFDGCMLRAFMPYTVSVPNAALLGLTVAAVSVMPSERICLLFKPDFWVRISLLPTDYTGPEAISAAFSDGVLVVE